MVVYIYLVEQAIRVAGETATVGLGVSREESTFTEMHIFTTMSMITGGMYRFREFYLKKTFPKI